MTNRQAATEFILEYIDLFIPGGENKAYYEAKLAALTNAEFHAYMEKLRSGEEILALVVPPHRKAKLTSAQNLKIAKKLGHSFFERLWLTDAKTGETYLTPIPYLVVDLPLRRQAQTLSKKVSIPEDSAHVDTLTGQPTGASKSAAVSFPELTALYAQGLEKTLEELVKYRGGDEKAFRAMNQQILQSGTTRLSTIVTDSRAKASDTLATLLRSAHLDNTL